MSTKRSTVSLRRLIQSDDGIGLVEVLVAFIIFAMISLGMAYSMLSMTRVSAESSNRETGANLAAAEIDRVQSQPDAFDVFSTTYTKTVHGTVFTIKSSIGWVSTTGSTGSCGTGGGNLQYKKVNVTVTWPGMYLNDPVRADSALAPDARINDPNYGTILVAITGEDGKGRSGVTVRVTPLADGSGAAAIVGTIDPTDSDGCTYILKVVPGNYRVEVEKAGYIDKTDAVTAIPFYSSQQVAAGATATAAFTYDAASTFNVKYAANSAAVVPVPSNLDTTYIGGLKNALKTTPVSPVKLYPMTNGYQAVAGDSATCLNVDSGLWTANSTMNAGVRADSVGTAPGGTTNINVPMGLITVPIPNSTSQYVTAVQQTMSATSGNPGCAAAKTYTFSTQFPKNAPVTLGLPYGKWIVYVGAAVGAKTTAVSGITIAGGPVQSLAGTPGALVTGLTGGGTVSGTTVTLDPRVAK